MADGFTSDDASNGTANGRAEVDHELGSVDWGVEDSFFDSNVIGEFSIHQSPKTSNATSPSAKIMLVGNGGTAGDAKVEKTTNPTELINTGDMQRLGGFNELSGGLAGKSVVARQEEHEADAASTSGMGGSPNGRGSASAHQGNFNKAPQTYSMGNLNRGYRPTSSSIPPAYHRMQSNVQNFQRIRAVKNNQGSMPFGAPTYFRSTCIHPSYHGFLRNESISQPRTLLRIDFDPASHHAKRPPTEQMVSAPAVQEPRDRQHLMDIPEEEVKTGKSGIIGWPGGRRDPDQAEFIWKGQAILIKAACQTKAHFRQLKLNNYENIAKYFKERAYLLGLENVYKYEKETRQCRKVSDAEIFDYIKNRRLTKDAKRDQSFAFKTDTNKDLGKTAAKIKPINPPAAVGKAHKARTAPSRKSSSGFVSTDDEGADLCYDSVKKRKLALLELAPMVQSLEDLPHLSKELSSSVAKYLYQSIDEAADRAHRESISTETAQSVDNRDTLNRLNELCLKLDHLASNTTDKNIRLSANELLHIFCDMRGLAFLQEDHPDKENCRRFCRYLRQEIEATVEYFNGELKAYNIRDFNVNKVPLLE